MIRYGRIDSIQERGPGDRLRACLKGANEKVARQATAPPRGMGIVQMRSGREIDRRSLEEDRNMPLFEKTVAFATEAHAGKKNNGGGTADDSSIT